MRGSRGIVVLGLLLAAVKLFLLPLQNTARAEFLSVLADCALTMLIAFAAWRASRRSLPYARVLWLCVVAVALLWSISFGAGAVAFLMAGSVKSVLSARWPFLVLGSFPLAIAFALPLLLSEETEKPAIGWLQALDIAQVGIIVFSAFVVFFYIPSLHFLSDADRLRHLAGLHVMRDSALALGYLYRGYRSRVPDLRRLHFRMSGFLAAHGLVPALLSYPMRVRHWPEALACFVTDLPVLFLLATAVSWRQGPQLEWPQDEPARAKGMPWTQVLALIMPVSVVVLASRIPGQYVRAAWIIVTASFFCYAARLFLMQRHQNKTLSSLAAMEERFAKAFRSSPAAITITRLCDGRIVEANDRWLELMRLTREEVIGKNGVELGIFNSMEEREKVVSVLREQGFVRGLSLDFRLAGRTLDTVVSAELIELGGEPLIIASILDVTEFKNVTQQLQQAQKMELVGSLAGGIAHDFNNLLTIISGYCALALTRELDAGLTEDVRRIKDASGKAAALTGQLLAFSRRQVLQPRNICLNAVVAATEELLRRTIGENITLVTSLAPDLSTMHADPVQMEQVVMNLAVNARDAMPHGGKLIFETKNLDLTSPYPEKGFEIPAGRYVMLIVTDTGIGIRPEYLDRIFEPFFTTKSVGAGTGLGLSTVYGIVKQSGGYIWASSDVGVGTTFKMCLPTVDLPIDAVETAEAEPENLDGNETVLVVDDDARVCELTAKILDQYGYKVITANSGEDAERRAREFDQEIHLLVTDVVMNGTSGTELAQHLKARRPGLKTIYMSGYPRVNFSRNAAVELCEPTLPKPFAPEELARQAKRTLNGFQHDRL